MELSAAFSEEERRNIAEADCPSELRRSSFGQCCVGANSQGGGLEYGASHCNEKKSLKGQASPGPLREQRYWSRFELAFELTGAPKQAMFELPDALELLPNGSRVAVFGDSVMNQVFDGLMCAASRDTRVNVTSIRRFPREQTFWMFGAGHRTEVDM
jgi:hypothetical protein